MTRSTAPAPSIRPFTKVWALCFALLATAYLGCASEPEAVESEELDEDGLKIASRTSAGGYTIYGASRVSCSTAVVKGLSEQLVAEINCMNPGALAHIDGLPGVVLSDAVFPYLQLNAAIALGDAAIAKPGIYVNSALRALPQQYLLSRWNKAGRCGIKEAATPGTSAHESGRAVDVNNWSPLKTTLKTKGFDWYGRGDEVHFTFDGEGPADVAGDSIRAFVALWNRNNPKNPIPEGTSTYTPAVAQRLLIAPADGFIIPRACGNPL